MIDATERIQPFSCGTQFMDWDAGNCGRCERDSEQCEIMQALVGACFGDGDITREIAERMGYTRHNGHESYGWPCCEKLPAWEDCEAHKAEEVR